jgi:hypothetical protein
LRNRRTQPYSGPNPIKARWRHPDDPRVRRERSFATKREARVWIAEQDTDSKRGVWTDPNLGRETVEAIAEQWQETTRHQIGPKTRQGYDSVLRNPIVQITMDVYGHLFPDGLDAVADAMDEGYRQGLHGAHKTPLTVASIS